MATETHDAMYQTVGGAEGIKEIVDLFYEKLWSDPDLQPTSPASTASGSSTTSASF